MFLTPQVTVYVHPIDVRAHPSVPPGWRWAVHLGEGHPSGLDLCMNAGWCPTPGEAAMEGEMVGVAVAKALRTFGVEASYTVTTLEIDPIRSGADPAAIGG